MAKKQTTKAATKTFRKINIKFVPYVAVVVVVFAVAIISSYGFGTSHAASFHLDTGSRVGGSLAVNPVRGTYAPGSVIQATIIANSGADSINAVQAKIIYDASRLDFVSLEEGGILDHVATTDTTTPGVIQIARKKTDDNPLAGMFPVVTVNFIAKRGVSGSAVVSIDAATSTLLTVRAATNILRGTSSAMYTIRSN
jgi:hypothetical protein